MRGRPLLALLSLALLPGCNLIAVGALALPGPPALASRAGGVFAIALADPAEGGAGAGAIAVPPPATDAALAPDAGEHVVQVIGRARVAAAATGMANVAAGYVTGTPVTIVDARSGRRLAAGVTYYDGSFALEVSFTTSQLPVVVSTELLGAADPQERTLLAAPALLRAGEGEQRVAVTPGSTALTAFLRGLAASTATGAPGGLPADPPDLAASHGPRLGSLIAGVDEEERASFMRLAEASADLRDAESLGDIRDGIARFVSRLSAGTAHR